MSKSEFTAVFETREKGKGLFGQITQFRDVREGRQSNIIAKKLVFNEDVTSNIIGHLTPGEYVIFFACIEFKNIEFKYPHGKIIEDWDNYGKYE